LFVQEGHLWTSEFNTETVGYVNSRHKPFALSVHDRDRWLSEFVRPLTSWVHDGRFSLPGILWRP